MTVLNRRDYFTSLKVHPEIFSDFLTDFDIHPVKKDVVRNTNEEAVKRSIKNLLLTNRGDRLFNPTLGSNIRSLLFELDTPATEQILQDYITTTIENYEPRALVSEVRVLSDDDNHTISATIVFSIINKQEPVILELILNRIR